MGYIWEGVCCPKQKALKTAVWWVGIQVQCICPPLQSCKFDLHVFKPNVCTCHVYSTLIYFTKQVSCNPTTTCGANKTQYVSKVGLKGCPTQTILPHEYCSRFLCGFRVYFSTWWELYNSSNLKKQTSALPAAACHWHKTKPGHTVCATRISVSTANSWHEQSYLSTTKTRALCVCQPDSKCCLIFGCFWSRSKLDVRSRENYPTLQDCYVCLWDTVRDKDAVDGLPDLLVSTLLDQPHILSTVFVSRRNSFITYTNYSTWSGKLDRAEVNTSSRSCF